MLSVSRRTEGCQCLDGRSVVNVWTDLVLSVSGRTECFQCLDGLSVVSA